MKRILFIVALFFWVTSFAQVSQSQVNLYKVRAAIMKTVRYPAQAARQGKPGACLFKISKQEDFIELETIFASSEDFKLEKDRAFLTALNKQLSDLPGPFEVVVPVNFYMEGKKVESPSKGRVIEPVRKDYLSVEVINVVCSKVFRRVNL
jgi:hypothetical protein